MARFYGSSSRDELTGQDNVIDSFVFRMEDLQPGDRVQGGAGLDYLRFTTSGSVSAALLEQVSGVEWIYLSGSGNRITLSDNFARSDQGHVNVAGSDGTDVVDATDFSSLS